MLRTLRLILLASLLFALSACAYIDTRSPYDEDLNNTDLGTKTGRASNYSLFWVAAWGDAGYAAAAKNGGITTLKHADVEVYSLLFGLYVRRTIVVYGD
ncbi:MAG: hypothetical protein C0623_05035 [Desulfuromonas sp.]|nr:MAG: hypothetical protein C0623_05035 [Desulfuromonas sp.]